MPRNKCALTVTAMGLMNKTEKPCDPTRWVTRLSWAGLVCASLGGMTQVWAQTPVPEIYTCIDANGRKLTSDRKIPECWDREQKILNPSGTVKAVVKPPLSAQAQQTLADKMHAEQQARARLLETKRRDQALLQRYPHAALHQSARTQALAQLQQSQHASTVQLLDLRNEHLKLQDEMAFYASNPAQAPLALRQKLDAVTQAMAAATKELAAKDAELTRINTRFDEELQRLQPLWDMAAAAKPTAH